MLLVIWKLCNQNVSPFYSQHFICKGARCTEIAAGLGISWNGCIHDFFNFTLTFSLLFLHASPPPCTLFFSWSSLSLSSSVSTFSWLLSVWVTELLSQLFMVQMFLKSDSAMVLWPLRWDDTKSHMNKFTLFYSKIKWIEFLMAGMWGEGTWHICVGMLAQRGFWISCLSYSVKTD